MAQHERWLSTTTDAGAPVESDEHSLTVSRPRSAVAKRIGAECLALRQVSKAASASKPTHRIAAQSPVIQELP